jgi:hypothetical protein
VENPHLLSYPHPRPVEFSLRETAQPIQQGKSLRPSLLLARLLSGGSAGTSHLVPQYTYRPQLRPCQEAKGFYAQQKAPPLETVHNLFRSLRATKGSAAIPLISTPYEIASAPVAPRNDITTQPLRLGFLYRGIEKKIKGQRFWTTAEATIRNFEILQHFCDAVYWQ